jgi:hypothetical protein
VGQRGRKSAALYEIPAVDGSPPWLEPSPGLTKQERKLFTEVVRSCSPKHFIESDAPQLVSYVQAILMARRCVRDPAKVSTWEKAVKVQAMLARSLRLTVQSRVDPKTIGRNAPHAPSLPEPWEM